MTPSTCRSIPYTILCTVVPTLWHSYIIEWNSMTSNQYQLFHTHKGTCWITLTLNSLSLWHSHDSSYLSSKEGAMSFQYVESMTSRDMLKTLYGNAVRCVRCSIIMYACIHDGIRSFMLFCAYMKVWLLCLTESLRGCVCVCGCVSISYLLSISVL